MKIQKLELDDIVELHNELIKLGGGDYGLQNSSSLEFALDRINYNNTKSEFFYNLALLLRSITQLHPFLDGNKRTGIAIIEIVLMGNELMLKLTDKQKELFVIDVAMGKYEDLKKLSKFLRKKLKRLK